jgi:hypothetical protein
MIGNNDGSLVYFDKSPVLFSGPGTTPKPLQKRQSRTEEAEAYPIAEWGDDNTFPLLARRAKETNPDLGSALDWKARALYAGGLHYKILDRATGQPITDATPAIKDKRWEIDQFMFRNRHYHAQAAVDFYDLYNVFAELIINEERNKVVYLSALEAQNCRFERRDQKADPKMLYIHPDWEEYNGQKDDPHLDKIPLVNPKIVTPDDIRAKGKSMRWAYPVSYPTGKNYYQYPFWWSVKVSKWLDFSNMIPTVKEVILKNIALIRYHIQMPDTWMKDRYRTWDKMTDAAKKSAFEKEFKIINEVLTKPENVGKSIFTTFKTSVQSQKDYANWKIEAIDDKMKDGALLADSSEGTIKIFSATSIDPSLHGLIPGPAGSNRSGSDKREALNIYMSLNQVHEDIILDPWHWTAWYNGWTDQDHEVKFYYMKPHLQTLNQVTPAKRETNLPSNANAD